MSSVVQAQKVVQRYEVGLDVYHRLLWGNRILCCSVINWFGRVGTGLRIKINLHIGRMQSLRWSGNQQYDLTFIKDVLSY